MFWKSIPAQIDDRDGRARARRRRRRRADTGRRAGSGTRPGTTRRRRRAWRRRARRAPRAACGSPRGSPRRSPRAASARGGTGSWRRPTRAPRRGRCAPARRARRARARRRGRAPPPGSSPVGLNCADAPSAPAIGADEVDDPRPPARGDRVVDAHDRARPHRGDVPPARPCGDRLRRLRAAVDVGEHDDVRAARDDVLGRELRIAAAPRGVGGVGDVPEAEERVDAADERARRRRVEVGAELVEHVQPSRARRRLGQQRGDLRLHPGDHAGRLREAGR